MAETVKSVLYVDYDSIHRSLKASGSPAADRLAQRAAGWVAAIELGRLVVPKAKAPTRRRMQARRCYTDPVLLGKGRLAFVACGFEVIDARDRGWPPAELRRPADRPRRHGRPRRGRPL